MSKIFKGNSCKNARIKVDYSGVKPNVTFSYPSKIYGTQGTMFAYLLTIWCVLGGLLGLGFMYGMDYQDFAYGSSTLEKFTDCRMQHLDLNFSTVLREECGEEIIGISIVRDGAIQGLKRGLFIILYFFLPPMLIYLPFRKYWSNVYPKFQGWLAKKKVMVFNPKDIRYDVQLGYYCEVPVFSNVILNYTATEDFSKLLKFMEIEEYKFKYVLHKHHKKMSKKHKKSHRRRELNEWIWYARFYFKDKPSNGQLEVIFK